MATEPHPTRRPMTPQEIREALHHPFGYVRRNLAFQLEREVPDEVIDACLADPDDDVRLAWARRRDYTLTPARIACGLSDPDPMVRHDWSDRRDFTPTAEQIEAGLTDSSEVIRAVWAGRPDYTPTPAQIRRGLNDDSLYVRDHWQKRMDKLSEPAPEAFDDWIYAPESLEVG